MIQDSAAVLTGSFSGNTVTGQSLVGAAGTYNGTNVIDAGGVGTQGGNPGAFSAGGDITTVVGVVQAFSAGATVTFNLVQADDVNLTVNAETLTSSGPLSSSALTAGAQTTLVTRGDAPSGVKRRYLGLQTVVAGASLTSGSITATMGANVSDAAANLGNTLYKCGFQVL